jgi:hypothetical protein
MESNILTTTESFICVLDSRNASTYYNGSNNSSVIFNFEDAIKIDGIKMMCCVDSFTMPNSIYNINELNNILNINNVSYNIPYGNYNANTFMIQLINQLGPSYNISLNPINNCFTLNSSNTFTINPSSIFQVMGFLQNTSYTSKNLIMPYPCNFNGIQSFNINFENVQTENIDSITKSNSSVIQSISVDNTIQQIFFNKTNDFFFEIKQDIIDYIHITIKDDLDNYLNLNNQHWNLTLQFSQLTNIDRFHQANNFNNILKNGYE